MSDDLAYVYWEPDSGPGEFWVSMKPLADRSGLVFLGRFTPAQFRGFDNASAK